MKTLKYFLLCVCALSLLLAYSCEPKDQTTENTAPTCKITEPSEGAMHFTVNDLVIKGVAIDSQNNIVSAILTVGDTEVVVAIDNDSFTHTVAAQDLIPGTLTISLYVEDKEGLSASSEVTVTIEEGEEVDKIHDFNIGYWKEENEIEIDLDGNWVVVIPHSEWLTFLDPKTNKWLQSGSVTGTGKGGLKIKSLASDTFEERKVRLVVTGVTKKEAIDVIQTASPDMFDMIEDIVLRNCAILSITSQGCDRNQDGKMSAYEASYEYTNKAFGINAGSSGASSTKGIEYFPGIMHLEVQDCNITALDLSGNPNLMSVLVFGNPGLEELNLSHIPLLVELGCDYDLFVKLDQNVTKALYSLGVYNCPDSSVELDFSEYSNLRMLYVPYNNLAKLDISGSPYLYKLVAQGNKFTELDISKVNKDSSSVFLLTNNPNLQTLYVWEGFTLEHYAIFQIDPGVNIVER